MTKMTIRLSQGDLEGALAEAVSIETQRIETIKGDMLDEVVGGVIGTTTTTTTSPISLPGTSPGDMTAGYYPTQRSADFAN